MLQHMKKDERDHLSEESHPQNSQPALKRVQVLMSSRPSSARHTALVSLSSVPRTSPVLASAHNHPESASRDKAKIGKAYKFNGILPLVISQVGPLIMRSRSQFPRS